MNIVLVAPSYPPTTGGMEFHVLNLANGLAARGHVVSVITAPVAGTQRRGVGGGVEVFRVPIQLLPLGRWFRGADIIHAHGARSPYSALGLLAGRREAPTVFTPHCFYPPMSKVARVKRALFDPTLGLAALRAADRVVALTEQDRADAIALGARPDKLRIVPNAVDFARNDAALARANANHSRCPARYALFTGRLDRNKHVDFLIEAIPALRARGLELVLMGPDGGSLTSLEKRVRQAGLDDTVHFFGRVSHSELMHAVRHASAVVLPSRYEGLPTSLIEAVAMGTPVVASKVGGTPYLLNRLEIGYDFPYDDQQGFLLALDAALASDQVSRDASAAFVRRHYAWPRVLDSLLAVYGEVG